MAGSMRHNARLGAPGCFMMHITRLPTASPPTSNLEEIAPVARMLWWSLIIAVPALGVSAQRLPPGAFARVKATAPAPCARISRLHNANSSAFFPGSLAFECLQSVPNKPEPAQQLIQSLKAFVQWQTTLAWLKDPPQSYMLPPVDIQGGLDNISATATAGGFASEYDFQLAIVDLITSAHDGHFAYFPDVFKAFSFGNELAADIVSVSTNGTSLPKLYRLSALQSKSGTTPAAITKINGQNATSFMLDLASRFSFEQDVDAQWNAQLLGYTNQAGANNPWAGYPVYLGPNLTLTYEDGTFETQQTYAALSQDVNFRNIATGEDFYNAFCNPSTASNATSQLSPRSLRAKPKLTRRALPVTGYPTPLVRESNESTTMGFFLDGAGFDDVAVLALKSFEDDDANTYLSNFQNAVETFLSKSRAAGKQRLVLDLTENGGGFILAGFELFAQLFPGVNAFNANNMRLSDGLVNISRILASLSPQDQEASVQASGLISDLSTLDLSKPQGTNFSSVDEFLTPVTLKDDKFTAYVRQVLESPGFTLTGTGNRSNGPAALFKPENIVLLTDGNCGSTCTIFSYLMIFQQDVKTVSVGGRPQAGVMQSIGGVEGSEVMMFSTISGIAAQAITIPTDQAEKQQLQDGELGLLAEGYAVQRLMSPDAGSINFKNNFAPSDSQTPLQFTYEAANCRFFYTTEMITSPELVWQYAVNATWTDPNKYCVEGSIVPVNTSKALDPAFATQDTGTQGGNGTDGDNGDSGTQGGSSGTTQGTDGGNSGSGQANGTHDNKDDKKNAAERVLQQGGAHAAWLLAAVTVVALNL
ncbi:hypothetical protein F5Y13DRAFT_199153 [Hypoxylon sp. FL1857]|nr:hypothetical protein F5Y13DRAFT_199153 [Hypoxylon sp. FL1857]